MTLNHFGAISGTNFGLADRGCRRHPVIRVRPRVARAAVSTGAHLGRIAPAGELKPCHYSLEALCRADAPKGAGAS
jgi:hypothetical protein